MTAWALTWIAGCSPSGFSPGNDVSPNDGAAVSLDGAENADSGSQPDAEGVRFANAIFPVVSSTCAVAGCHDMATQMNHYASFSTAPLTYARWVNGPGVDFCVPSGLFVQKIVVVPGRPQDSFLIEKISSTREELCTANHYPRMPPPPRPMLSAAQIELWSRWISEGATEN